MNKVCVSGIYFIFIIFLTKETYFGLAFLSCSFVMECTRRRDDTPKHPWHEPCCGTFNKSNLVHATVRQGRMREMSHYNQPVIHTNTHISTQRWKSWALWHCHCLLCAHCSANAIRILYSTIVWMLHNLYVGWIKFQSCPVYYVTNFYFVFILFCFFSLSFSGSLSFSFSFSYSISFPSSSSFHLFSVAQCLFKHYL